MVLHFGVLRGEMVLVIHRSDEIMQAQPLNNGSAATKISRSSIQFTSHWPVNVNMVSLYQGAVRFSVTLEIMTLRGVFLTGV